MEEQEYITAQLLSMPPYEQSAEADKLYMQALQEECGEVAIGCKVKAFDNLQMYLTLINQSSIITIQVPEESFTQQVQDQVDSIVEFFHNTLESNC